MKRRLPAVVLAATLTWAVPTLAQGTPPLLRPKALLPR